MYKKTKPSTTTLKLNTTYAGESIEQKVNRVVNNKEPIKDGAPLIYTERKHGVNPDHDIRTDRWEHAIGAMDLASKSWVAKRENRIAEQAKVIDMKKDAGKPAGTNEGGQPS